VPRRLLADVLVLRAGRTGDGLNTTTTPSAGKRCLLCSAFGCAGARLQVAPDRGCGHLLPPATLRVAWLIHGSDGCTVLSFAVPARFWSFSSPWRALRATPRRLPPRPLPRRCLPVRRLPSARRAVPWAMAAGGSD